MREENQDEGRAGVKVPHDFKERGELYIRQYLYRRQETIKGQIHEYLTDEAWMQRPQDKARRGTLALGRSWCDAAMPGRQLGSFIGPYAQPGGAGRWWPPIPSSGAAAQPAQPGIAAGRETFKLLRRSSHTIAAPAAARHAEQNFDSVCKLDSAPAAIARRNNLAPGIEPAINGSGREHATG